jgi:carboxypeptidase Q
MRTRAASLVLCFLAAPLLALAQEPVDLQVVTRIRDEGLNRSKVMETAAALTDEIGPRLTNSPAYRKAAEWTRDRLTEFGIANAHLEPFEFGRGWTFSSVSVRMTKPAVVPLDALPKGWSAATASAVTGQVTRVTIEKEEDLEQYRGKLAGKILLLAGPPEREQVEQDEAPDLYERYTEEELDALEQFPIRDRSVSEVRRRMGRSLGLAKKRTEFFVAEGVAATVEASSREALLLRVGGTNAYAVGENPGPPALVIGAEQYNRIGRLLDQGTEIELEVAVQATFLEDETKASNVVAEIAGSDPTLKGEVVMAGAHLDSWHAGTGATDDAAGCSVVMEAARILQAVGAKPRRTVRVALWAAEEQGLRGSRAYVAEHFATRPEPTDPAQRELPEFMRRGGPLQFKPEWSKLSAYFNLDNGGGKIRGIYAQENAALRPIFAAWLEPFHDLGADTVTLRRTGGTDHQSFDGVGLPGFQFIQDRLDYMTRTHHTQADTYERLNAADLKQASVIMASFLYNAAMRAEMLPRKPIQEAPAGTPPGGAR